MLLSEELRDCSDLQSTLEYALVKGMEVTGTELGNIQLLNKRSGYLTIEAQRGFREDFLTFFRRVDSSDGSACGRALKARKPVVIEDVAADEDFAECRQVALDAGFRAVQSTPLIAPGGAFIGVLSTHFPTVHKPSDSELVALQLIAELLSAEIVRRKAEDPAARGGKVPVNGKLSSRECEVLHWVALGKSAREIGQILKIAKRTVDEHARSAAQKMDALNRTHAVAISLRDQLITPWPKRSGR